MTETDELVHQFKDQESGGQKAKQGVILVFCVLLTIGAGIASGYFLVNRTTLGGGELGTGGSQSKGKEIGSTDVKTFKDTAAGVIEKGGIDGEGTHQLVREGGPSQTAYLTSSVMDLDQFVGKKVQVWGETFKGQKAGWLMDVGRLKILE